MTQQPQLAWNGPQGGQQQSMQLTVPKLSMVVPFQRQAMTSVELVKQVENSLAPEQTWDHNAYYQRAVAEANDLQYMPSMYAETGVQPSLASPLRRWLLNMASYAMQEIPRDANLRISYDAEVAALVERGIVVDIMDGRPVFRELNNKELANPDYDPLVAKTNVELAVIIEAGSMYALENREASVNRLKQTIVTLQDALAWRDSVEKTDYETLEGKYQAAIDQFGHAANVQLAALEGEVNSKQLQIEYVKEEKESIDEAVIRLAKEKEELRQRGTQLVQEYNTRAAEWQQQQWELMQKYQVEEAKLKECTERQLDVETQYAAEIDKARGKVAKLEAELSQRGAAQVETSNRYNQILQEQVEKVKQASGQEAENASKLIEEVQREKVRSNDLHAREVKRLKAEIAELEATIVTLKGDLKLRSGEMGKLEDEVRAIKTRQDNAESEMRANQAKAAASERQCRSQVARLEAEISGKDSEIGTLTRRLEAADARLTQATTDHSALTRKLSASVADYTRLQQQLTDVMEKSEASTDELTQKLDQCEILNAEQKRQLTTLTGDLKRARDALASTGSDLQRQLEDHMDELEASLEAAKAEIAEKQKLVEKTRKECTAALEESARQMQRVRQEHDAMVEQMSNTRTSADTSMQKTVDALKRELSAAVRKNNETNMVLKQMEAHDAELEARLRQAQDRAAGLTSMRREIDSRHTSSPLNIAKVSSRNNGELPVVSGHNTTGNYTQMSSYQLNPAGLGTRLWVTPAPVPAPREMSAYATNALDQKRSPREAAQYGRQIPSGELQPPTRGAVLIQIGPPPPKLTNLALTKKLAFSEHPFNYWLWKITKPLSTYSPSVGDGTPADYSQYYISKMYQGTMGKHNTLAQKFDDARKVSMSTAQDDDAPVSAGRKSRTYLADNQPAWHMFNGDCAGAVDLTQYAKENASDERLGRQTVIGMDIRLRITGKNTKAPRVMIVSTDSLYEVARMYSTPLCSFAMRTDETLEWQDARVMLWDQKCDEDGNMQISIPQCSIRISKRPEDRLASLAALGDKREAAIKYLEAMVAEPRESHFTDANYKQKLDMVVQEEKRQTQTPGLYLIVMFDQPADEVSIGITAAIDVYENWKTSEELLLQQYMKGDKLGSREIWVPQLPINESYRDGYHWPIPWVYRLTQGDDTFSLGKKGLRVKASLFEFWGPKGSISKLKHASEYSRKYNKKTKKSKIDKLWVKEEKHQEALENAYVNYGVSKRKKKARKASKRTGKKKPRRK